MATNRSGNTKQFASQLEYGLNAGGDPMGAIMAFMGRPFQQKQGGQWMTVNPLTQSTYQTGTTNPAAAAATKPPVDDPTLTDEEKRRREMIKAGLPPFYVDWLRTSGQYGGVPPTPGLLG